MSLANDLLNTLSASQVDENDDTLVIDHYTRQIAIPKRITNLGVENDDDTLRLNFRMPRYIGKIDLSKFRIRVNYMNARGDSDAYDVVDAAVVGSNITFSWEVGPVAVAYKGNTVFNVCVVLLNSDGNVDREYNTTIATLPVLEGLEVDEQSAYAYSDLIEQWRQALFGIGDTEEAAIKAVSQAEQQNIVNKGAEVLATIPADYTTAVSMTDNADRTKADAIVCEADGEFITVDDSSDDYVRGLRVFGKTTQVKTTGKNLLNVTGASATISGIKYTVYPDGSIMANGTATDDSFFTIGDMTYTGGVTYKISGCPGNGSTNTYSLYTLYGDGVYAFDTGNGVTFTPETDMTKHVSIVIKKGLTVSNCLYHPMVRLASIDDDTYEPYSGGFVSPSPDWPQELVDLENLTVVVYGSNLVDINQLVLASNKSMNITDDGYTITLVGGSDKTYAYSHYDIPTEVVYALRGKKIRLSSDFISKSLEDAYSPVQLNVKCADNTFHYPVNHSTKLYHEFTVPDNTTEIRFGIYTNNSNSLLASDNTVVVKGVRLTLAEYPEYEPYKPIGIITATNHTIPGIPVTSGGNYTDSNGQQWICDEIDFERRVLIQRINTISLPSTFVINEATNEMWIQLPDSEAAAHNTPEVQCLCTHFPATSRQEIYDRAFEVGYRAIAARDRFVRVVDNVMFNGNPDALNAWIAQQSDAGVDVMLSYILATPIEYELADDAFMEFQFLHTNCPNTTVMNNVGAYMALKYNSDTKTYLNKYIRPETWIFTLEDGSTVTKVVHSA